MVDLGVVAAIIEIIAVRFALSSQWSVRFAFSRALSDLVRFVVCCLIFRSKFSTKCLSIWFPKLILWDFGLWF